MASQEQRRLETRAKILTVAAQAFATGEYDAVSLADILAAAAVSKGALYHHFPSKLAILTVLYEEAAEKAAAEAKAAASAPDLQEGPALVRIVAASLGWLAAVSEPSVGRLVLDLGPRVLGRGAVAAVEERHLIQPMTETLRHAVQEGDARIANVALAARVVSAALCEVALSHREKPLASGEAAAMVRGVVRGVAQSG